MHTYNLLECNQMQVNYAYYLRKKKLNKTCSRIVLFNTILSLTFCPLKVTTAVFHSCEKKRIFNQFCQICFYNTKKCAKVIITTYCNFKVSETNKIMLEKKD